MDREIRLAERAGGSLLHLNRRKGLPLTVKFRTGLKVHTVWSIYIQGQVDTYIPGPYAGIRTHCGEMKRVYDYTKFGDVVSCLKCLRYGVFSSSIYSEYEAMLTWIGR